MKKLILSLTFIIIGFFAVNAQTMNHSKMSAEQMKMEQKMQKQIKKYLKNPKYTEFNKAMRELWSAHMYWTLITVDAYYNDPKGLDAKLQRLLQNQKDIGNAVVPFYGQEAGDALAKLLTEHILGAVPVLQAAKENNAADLEKAVVEWYANAKEIGDFLHAANPENWSAEATGGALEMHITHTIDYSVSILKGNYNESFGGFEEALHHMLELADLLTYGITKQFPKKVL